MTRETTQTQLRPLRIAHVVVQIDVEASGPAYSVRALAEAMASRGHEVSLFTTGDAPSVLGVDVHRFPTLSVARRSLAISPALNRALVLAGTDHDLIHTHSMWMMPNVYPAWAAFRSGCTLITSPRGVFADWALRRSAWKKRAMWLLLQQWTVRASRCLHATSAKELDEIKGFGITKPVAVVPNGIHMPARPNARQPLRARTLLCLARMHPVKGIDVLLRAWQRLAPDFPSWTLRLVGPDADGYTARMQQLAGELRLSRVDFVGPKYGEEKAAEYSDAEIYVLPSHTENFGMTVLEALAAGRPVVVTRGTPWERVVENGCGWWVSHDDLEPTLREALSLPREELLRRGKLGREWVQGEFSWDSVARRMEAVYRWAISGSPNPPDLVR